MLPWNFIKHLTSISSGNLHSTTNGDRTPLSHVRKEVADEINFQSHQEVMRFSLAP